MTNQEAMKSLEAAMRSNEMDIEEYAETKQSELDELYDDYYWRDEFSATGCLNFIKRLAVEEGITLLNEETWDYETYFWEDYQASEKGLS